MSQYATLADLEDTGLPPGVLEDIPDPEKFLVNASAHVDSYLRGRYRLPLSAPYPAELTQCVLAIAAYHLLHYRGFDADSQDQLVVDRLEYYTGKPGMKGWLDKLSTGQVNLALESDATPSVSEGGPIVSSLGPGAAVYCRPARGWRNHGFF